jgi:hypothetical protein
VLKNVTITVEEEVLRWARRQAAEENTSVSRLVGKMLADKMRMTGEYWKAYERWRTLAVPTPGVDAPKPMTRDETHERR